MTQFQDNAVFWVEVGKILPNPLQPRKEFDPEHLRSLSDSIRQYGVLQALVVTRLEIPKENGDGLDTRYELIAGERRLRAAKMAGVSKVPVLIRTGEEGDKLKLELAIIENVQREDLNSVDRARAFEQLTEKFDMTHADIAKKVGKSREYVSNSLRILSLPEHVVEAITAKKITEGHARPLLMLNDKPEEQTTLLKEIVHKDMSVRQAELIARQISPKKAKVKTVAGAASDMFSQFAKEFQDMLGTRVEIQKKQNGGRIYIDFFSEGDLENILSRLKHEEKTTKESKAPEVSESKEKKTFVGLPSYGIEGDDVENFAL